MSNNHGNNQGNQNQHGNQHNQSKNTTTNSPAGVAHDNDKDRQNQEQRQHALDDQQRRDQEDRDRNNTSIGGQEVKTVGELRKILDELEDGDSVTVQKEGFPASQNTKLIIIRDEGGIKVSFQSNEDSGIPSTNVNPTQPIV